MPGFQLPGDEGEKDARRIILQVKETIENCLRQGMSKAQMFRAIREARLPQGAAFAVYKELRDQNGRFFKDYFCMVDLKEQRERLNHLIQMYRMVGGGGAGGAGASVSDTAGTPMTVVTDAPEVLDDMDWRSVCDLDCLEIPVDSSWHQVAPVKFPLPQEDLPAAAEQLPDHEQPVANGEAQCDIQQDAVHWQAAEQPPRHRQPMAGREVQETAWPQPAEHLLAWEPLPQHQQPMATSAFHEPPWPQEAAHLPAWQQPVANGWVDDPALALSELETDAPAMQLPHYQEQVSHLTALQQLPYQEQVPANCWIHGVTMAPMAGLPDDAMACDYPPLHGCHWRWQGPSEVEPPQHRRPGFSSGQ